ncbi:MAG: hypothetical protein U0V54_04005 [Saprospiraceae bacterium]
MISAPNHRLPLSGNKIYWIFITLWIIGCTPATKLQKDKTTVVVGENKEIQDQPETKPKTSQDTISTPESKPKEEVFEKEGKQIENPVKKYSHFDLAVVLPFNDNESNERFLQYYGGMKLAADELQMEGYDLTVKVYSADEANLMNQLQTDGQQLIFAPSEETTLKQILEYGKSQNIPVVSPFFSLSTVENAPNYVQLKPSLRSHFVSIIKHALQQHSVEDIVLVGRNTKNDKAWFKFFQATAAEIGGGEGVKAIKEFFVLDDSLATGINVFGELMLQGKKVFIFPNYSYKDELYLYNAMRRLLAERGIHEITVYGMPILKDSEKMGFDFFSGLHIHVPASRYIDNSREEVKSFDRKFFDRYGALPEGDAYEGFDHFLFIARHLSQYGADFARYLSTDSGQYLQAKFDVRGVKSEGSPAEIDYFENKHLDILYFNGSRFVQAF